MGRLCFLAEQLLALGQIAEAGERALRALRIATAIGDRVGQVDALAILAHVAAERHEPSVAGCLWGALESEAARARPSQAGSARVASTSPRFAPKLHATPHEQRALNCRSTRRPMRCKLGGRIGLGSQVLNSHG